MRFLSAMLLLFLSVAPIRAQEGQDAGGPDRTEAQPERADRPDGGRGNGRGQRGPRSGRGAQRPSDGRQGDAPKPEQEENGGRGPRDGRGPRGRGPRDGRGPRGRGPRDGEGPRGDRTPRDVRGKSQGRSGPERGRGGDRDMVTRRFMVMRRMQAMRGGEMPFAGRGTRAPRLQGVRSKMLQGRGDRRPLRDA